MPDWARHLLISPVFNWSWGPGWILFVLGPLPRGIATTALAWIVLAVSAAVALTRIVIVVTQWKPEVLYPGDPWRQARVSTGQFAGLLSSFILGIWILIGAFSFAYLQLAHNTPVCFRGLDGHPHANVLYVTVATLTAVGSGEITPHSEVCRLLVAGQGVVGLVVIGFGIAGVTSRILQR